MSASNIKNGVTIFGVRGTFTGWVDQNSRQFVFNGVGSGDRSGTCIYVTNFGKYYVGNWKYICIRAVVDTFGNYASEVYFRTSETGSVHALHPYADGYGKWVGTDVFVSGYKDEVFRGSVRSFFTNKWIYGMSTTSQTNQWGRGLGAILWFSNTPLS